MVKEKNMKTDIIFEEDAIEEILKAFDKKIDDQGFIVEDTEEAERVLTPEGEEVKAKELGMISKGSEIFIKNNFVSILSFVKNRGREA